MGAESGGSADERGRGRGRGAVGAKEGRRRLEYDAIPALD